MPWKATVVIRATIRLLPQAETAGINARRRKPVKNRSGTDVSYNAKARFRGPDVRDHPSPIRL
jgi:hypothetical protein